MAVVGHWFPMMHQPTVESSVSMSSSAEKGPALASSEKAHALTFRPRRTISIELALATRVPMTQAIRGARIINRDWQVWIYLNKRHAFYGRLDRQRAAVAADVVLMWLQRCQTNKATHNAFARQFNVSGVAYERDLDLCEQLSHIVDVEDMRLFLGKVIPQNLDVRWRSRGYRAKRRKQLNPQQIYPSD